MNEKRWSDAVAACSGLVARTADTEYLCGLALANAGKMEESKQAFLRGQQMQPRDPRFPVELGGVAFKQKNYCEATGWLLRAERLSPADNYLNEFLGTVFFLEGNLEASLKYWNRMGRPRLEQVRFEPMPTLDPVLLDRAVASAPGSLLTSEDYLTTEARLKALGVFPSLSLQPEARDDERFDLVIRNQERNGFGADKWDALLSTFGSAIVQTVTPQYYNIGRSATNVTALWRWDEEKRKVLATVSGPLRRKAQWRYRAGLDLRNENWNVENFSSSPAPRVGYLNLRRSAGFVEVTSINSGRWSWSTSGEVSYRDYRSTSSDSLLAGQLLLEGYQLKHVFQTKYELIRVPQRHYFVSLFGSTQTGRVWAGDSPVFAKVQAGVRQQWSAGTSGGDYEFLHTIRAGKTAGEVPFDELFMLGVERDNDLKMRGHVGTRDGQKGSAPLGRNFIVSNLDFDKKIWSNGLMTIKAGLFVDAGKISDPLSFLGSRQWLFDTGGQVKVRILGLSVGATYGRDLREGRNAFYATVGK